MHVLQLEDDNPLREIMKVALVAMRPDIVLKQFVNSDDALAYITEHVHDIDLFILDIRVPGSMDGVTVAQKIRELGCPGIIAITSAYRRPDRKRLAELDCQWLAKPWHVMEVMDKLLPKIGS
ncbi:MAG: hypothetical protein OHK0046_20840 [Anaerolineae bacterium]